MKGTVTVTRRGVFGWLFLLLFIGFNLYMAQWLVSYWYGLYTVASAADQTVMAFAALGGTGIIAFFWLAGAVITGLLAYFTRGKTYLVANGQSN